MLEKDQGDSNSADNSKAKAENSRLGKLCELIQSIEGLIQSKPNEFPEIIRSLVKLNLLLTQQVLEVTQQNKKLDEQQNYQKLKTQELERWIGTQQFMNEKILNLISENQEAFMKLISLVSKLQLELQNQSEKCPTDLNTSFIDEYSGNEEECNDGRWQNLVKRRVDSSKSLSLG